jgi:hypothetical protein
MPANLPPQYFEAEKAFRRAKSSEEKIAALENMLAIMPKHKGTDKLRADLRRRIAKVSQESQIKHVLGRKELRIRKEGAGQITLVGLTNVGKSKLVSALTEASPTVADYPFTTRIPTPGMMRFENIQIQLIDAPPITDQNSRAWLPALMRNADALLMVVDLGDDPVEQTEVTIEELGKLKIMPAGGKKMDAHEQGVIEKPILLVGNKSDLLDSDENMGKLKRRYSERFPIVFTSCTNGTGLDEVRQMSYQLLGVIRTYTKGRGGKPDFGEPIILKQGSTIGDFAESVHKDFRNNLKYAQIWGSGKFDGQRVSRDYILQDGDVVELHI